MPASGCWLEKVGQGKLFGRKTCLKHNLLLIVLGLLMRCLFADTRDYNRRYSHASKYSRNYNSVDDNLVSTGPPEFDTNTVVNITVEKAQAAFLHCKVKNQGGYTVSWVRYTKDFNIVSIGDHIFIPDPRFNLIRIPGSADWTLRIVHVRQTDAGIYECQIGTTPKLGRNVTLQVIDALQSDSEDLRPRARTMGDEVARAVIKGERETHVGASLNLTCFIASSGTTPSSNNLIKWYHNETTSLNYEYSLRSGHQTEIYQSPSGMFSRLIIRNVLDYHAGKYTCAANNAESTTVFVHIKPSTQPLALKRSSGTSTSVISPLLLLVSVHWSLSLRRNC